MTAAILFATLTIGLMFGIPTVASRYGTDVSARFLEKGAPYDATTLRQWVDQHPGDARGYAFPVLFPLDFLLMLFLAAFAATASRALAEQSGFLATRSWLVVIVPFVYFAADVIEDTLLATMLTSSARISDALVSVTSGVTGIKLVAATAVIAQTALLSVLALYRGGR